MRTERLHRVRIPAGTCLLALLATLACASPAPAEPGVLLGAVRLAEGKDRDVVRLPPCRSSANRAVRELRLVVDLHPAELDLLRVVFHNGERQELHVRQHFGAGDGSRWMDLRGPRRCIQRIVVVGDTDTPGWRPGKQARVSFWGR